MPVRRTIELMNLWLFACVATVATMIPAWARDTAPHPISLPSQENLPSKPISMDIYIDFYCLHCHDFVTTILPILKEKFGPFLKIQYIGLPVVENTSTLPFEIYEAARLEGQGEDMVHLLFETLQIKRRSIQPIEMRESLYQTLGLDVERMNEHLKSGRAKDRVEQQLTHALKIGLDMTPVVVLDSKYLVIDTSADNLRLILDELLFQKAKHTL
jgi:predicted DsbA family dithiol-disulfide isomerase